MEIDTQKDCLSGSHEPIRGQEEECIIKSEYVKDDIHIKKKKAFKVNRRKKVRSFDPLVNTADDNVYKISEVIIQKFLCNWYHSITQNDEFVEETKVLLEGVIKKFLLILPLLDYEKIVVKCLVIFLNHLKEFKRSKSKLDALQLDETVEDVYRYAYPDNKDATNLQNHLHKLTEKLCHGFFAWETWHSLSCRLLIRIISRMVFYQLIDLISNPNFIIFNLCLMLDKNKQILDQIQTYSNDNKENQTPPLPEKTDEKITSSVTDAAQNDVVLHQERPAEIFIAPKNDVCHLIDKIKINDNRLTTNEKNKSIEKSKSVGGSPNKTLKHYDMDKATIPIIDNSDSVNWSHFSNNKNELNIKNKSTLSISSIDSTRSSSMQNDAIIDSGVKEYVPADVTTSWTKDDYDLVQIGQDLLASEITSLGKRLWNFSSTDSELDISPNTRANTGMQQQLDINDDEKSFSDIAMQNMKELQMKSKEFQTKSMRHVSDAMTKIEDIQDEAAGYVEGILDIGIAGFKKGLRLTGLQESGHNLSPPRSRPLNTSPYEPNPLICDISNKSDNDLKSKQLLINNKSKKSSPEYEEPADFASTIAKLRHLLQQKSSGDSANNSPLISPTAADAILQESLGSKEIFLSQKNDNFLSRTVSGMFNSIKTALPANVIDMANVIPPNSISPMNQRWIFNEKDNNGQNIMSMIDAFFKERSEYDNIDVAFDAFDTLDGSQNDPIIKQLLNESDDNLFGADFEECFRDTPIAYLLTDILCELLNDKSNLTQEPIVRMALMLFGNVTEYQFKNLEKLIGKHVNNFDNIIRNITELKLDNRPAISDHDVILIIKNQIPRVLELLFGGDDNLFESIEFFLDSLKSKQINVDLSMQFLEIITSSIVVKNIELSPKVTATRLL